MRITYQTTFAARCPVDDSRDIYELTVTSDAVIPVETILAAISQATLEPRFQEVITDLLASALGDVTVKTIGTHSGVLTTVIV